MSVTEICAFVGCCCCCCVFVCRVSRLFAKPPQALCVLFLRESCDLVSTAAGSSRQPDFSLPTTSCVGNLWLSLTQERGDPIAAHTYSQDSLISVELLCSPLGEYRNAAPASLMITGLHHCIPDELRYSEHPSPCGEYWRPKKTSERTLYIQLMHQIHGGNCEDLPGYDVLLPLYYCL